MKKLRIQAIVHQSLSFFFIAFWLSGCTNRGSSGKNNASPQTAVPPISAPYKKPPASSNDTLVVENKAAVFYNPDSLQLDKIKAISKKENFETAVHNCFFLMRNARNVLKEYWPKIRIIETKKRYLLFLKDDKAKTCIDLNSEGDMCGIFLFDGRKEPELVDMMNIDTALGFYFGK